MFEGSLLGEHSGMCLIVGMVLVAVVAGAATPQAPVSRQEQTRWLRWVIPLPKQVRIEGKVHVSASDVRVRLRDGAGDVEKHAADELAALFAQAAKAHRSEAVPAAGGSFEVLVGACDTKGRVMGITVPGAAELAKLPNPEQAYVIHPMGTDRIVLTALDERGVYYAVRTFRQLVEAHLADGKVAIPLAAITDWPDLAERGEWGGSTSRDIEWFGRHKMNLAEVHASVSIAKDGRGVATIAQDLLDRGRLHAVKVVPIIMHLDYLQGSGIGKRFPELKGVGESARPRTDTMTLCFSKPKTVEILADWMRSLAALKGVTDINVWLSEYEGQCGCAECEKAKAAGVPQHALETLAVKRALEAVRREHPHLRARVLLTQGTYPVNDRVLAAAAPRVQVSYYCGGGRPRSTYNSSREPMIYPLLADYAAKGHWLGVYPQFTASYGTVCPWSGPQFIKSLITEFVDKGLDCVCGYTVPENRLHDFNVTAAAEWSWNVRGRSEREFAAAWATRRGLSDPDAAAEWAVLLGPVGWDIYGSGYAASTFTRSFVHAARLVTDGVKPRLGEGLWRYFPTAEHMDENLAACRKALALAERLGAPALVAETRVIQGYMTTVKQLYAIGHLVADDTLAEDDLRKRLQEAMCRLAAAGMQIVGSLRDWEKALGPPITAARYFGTIRAAEETVQVVGNALAAYGIEDPAAPYRRQRIGTWSSSTFGGKSRLRMRWEVTRKLFGAGAYRVGFRYTRGAHGLPIRRVAIACAPKDRPDELTELSVDEHPGFAGNQSEANTYAVSLAKVEPGLCYFVVADTAAPPSTNGEVWICRAGEPPAAFPVPPLRPLTPAQRRRLPRKDEPVFTGKGLRVGVVRGGYGSTSLLTALATAKGVDAQPVRRIEQEAASRCQVLVLPQPRDARALGKGEAALLRRFVRRGGGLVVTHNAVGYRGLPAIIPQVCAKGLQNIRDTEWVVAAEHPVTRGIPAGQALSHSYYDHIELEPGPDGLAVAKAKRSGRPVVVCGQSGKGRYVACGLAIGLSPQDSDVAPRGAERTLLANAVRWAAGPTE